jgi:hypothetical protein
VLRCGTIRGETPEYYLDRVGVRTGDHQNLATDDSPVQTRFTIPVSENWSIRSLTVT